jgi:lactate 2-monooxygenase
MSDGTPELQAPVLADFQNEIYAGGLIDEMPRLPVPVAELEERARAVLSAEAFGYVAGGAGAERTMRANLRAFERREIVPRMLRDVSVRDLSTSVLGTVMPAPVMLAPVGVQSIVHPEGELATGKAAAAQHVPMILSTAASHTIEEVAEAMEGASRWYQLYWPKDRDLAASFLARAEQAAYSAVVVTLDTWLLGWRPRDLQHAYLPFLKGEGVANYFSDPVFRAALETAPEEDPGPAIGHWANQFANPSVTWADLAWLRDQTRLPIVLKGILHPEDARRAVHEGVDGLIVSKVAARSTGRSALSMPFPRSARSSGTCRFCSTAASVPERTSSRRSRWAPTRCVSAGPTCGVLPSKVAQAWNRCCAACSPSSI